jgi:predicted RNA-binding protein YlqC (UPF0109 family)
MALLDDVQDDELASPLEEIVEETQQAQPVVEDDLPEKYRGKSAKEIALMHQEAEKLIGKQGSEVGELRKVVDDFIRTQTLKEVKQEEELDDTDSYFTDPKQAVKKAIDSHPAVKEAQQASLAMKREQVLNKIGSKFPDFMETVQDPSFAEWVQSSRIRTEMYARAETQFDYDAAEELLSTWQDRKGVAKQVAETSKVDRDKQLKAASVDTQGSTETSAKKKYRRSDIIKLMQTDYDRYIAMSPEIEQAYRDGRVING